MDKIFLGKSLIIIIPRIFIKNPIKAISAILTRPLPNIIALGGVATGIIKAQDAEKVAGIASYFKIFVL